MISISSDIVPGRPGRTLPMTDPLIVVLCLPRKERTARAPKFADEFCFAGPPQTSCQAQTSTRHLPRIENANDRSAVRTIYLLCFRDVKQVEPPQPLRQQTPGQQRDRSRVTAHQIEKRRAVFSSPSARPHDGRRALFVTFAAEDRFSPAATASPLSRMSPASRDAPPPAP